MGHQIEQLKEEIASKDEAIVKESYEFQKAEKQRENKENEVARLKELIKNNQVGGSIVIVIVFFYLTNYHHFLRSSFISKRRS